MISKREEEMSLGALIGVFDRKEEEEEEMNGLK